MVNLFIHIKNTIKEITIDDQTKRVSEKLFGVYAQQFLQLLFYNIFFLR